MSEPTPQNPEPQNPEPQNPEPQDPEPQNAEPQDPASGTEQPEPEAPLNRAARRSKAKAQPGHVGPQNDATRAGRGPRPHTKRSL